MEAANSALEANLELDRKELARVAKEADEVETALATAIRESDVVLVDKVKTELMQLFPEGQPHIQGKLSLPPSDVLTRKTESMNSESTSSLRTLALPLRSRVHGR